ncbi:DUF1428 domain-containing protein [Gymnodinialimonas ceratoperidinii]|uniref:DUF1428 domain-containing protein n=1 Tax=Gymnodinialimonas ceratoperidinii TaxID=2856823 RepID=A0A8F6TV43_9RHOB|nr:DUF1428 domain-containing protein [Gymnodinialimonas ceratoperidinii]QXT39013.1 DUF1428 domain-containing protein [Gymnodinialimonas ceratoperidinii]
MHIDGFVIPVKASRKDEYASSAKRILDIYRKHGATRCVECWGEGMDQGDITSFPRAVRAAEDEAIVFSWMEFPDKATAEAAHKAVWEDPAMAEIMSDDLVDGKRMIMGSFDLLLDVQ